MCVSVYNLKLSSICRLYTYVSLNISFLYDIKCYLMAAMGQGVGIGLDWEAGFSRCKLLHMERINKKVLLYSTGNNIYLW